MDGLDLVGYPNRDSVGFRDWYGIPEAKTVFRGTLRYAGFPEIVRGLVEIGDFSQEEAQLTWLQLTAKLLGLSPLSITSATEAQDAVTQKLSSFLSDEEDIDRVLAGLSWIGLFDPNNPVEGRGTPLGTLCAVLERRMAY